MRQLRLGTFLLVDMALLLAAPMASAQVKHEEVPVGGHAAEEAHAPVFTKYKALVNHKPKQFDLAKPADKEELTELIRSGHVAELEGEAEIQNPMSPQYDLAIWAIVIFVLLLIVLRKMAWGPMLEGLQKREETIKNSVEEAKRARADTERMSQEFKVKMDQAYAEIPKIMENARRDAEAFKEEMRAETTKDIQAERQRLRREIETARDQALQELWNQAAQLATLISAKAIGRSLTEDDHRRLLDEAIRDLGQTAKRG
jgi:F-type H+-transporting ATPase subunit b